MMWKFKEFGGRIAAKDDKGNTITYSNLAELEELFRREAGRKLVFCVTRNCIEALAGYAAMINAGTVPVMISDDMDKGLLEHLFEQYQPEYIWTASERIHEFSYEMVSFSFRGYSLIRTLWSSEELLYEELALLLTTSGSTGSPKLVRQSYTNIRANTESIVEYLKLDDEERPITTLPMNYTYGLSIINSHLYVGAAILVTDKTIMQKEFWEFFKQEKATSFGGVPYTYEMLKKLRIFKMDLPSLKTMTQAGGKLTTELHREFAEFAAKTGRNFVVMYGQTEATARMAYLPAERSLEKVGSMGIAIPGGEFILIDANGQEIQEEGKIGELVYIGKNVTLGYAQDRKDLAKGDERKGRLETGDMARRDSDGYYYIAGRKKRFLKIYGKRVNLDEIERLVKAGFDYLDCASTGTDDNLYLFVTDEKLTGQVREYISDITKINLSAIHSKYIKEIPKNDSGKTLYVELEKLCDL